MQNSGVPTNRDRHHRIAGLGLVNFQRGVFNFAFENLANVEGRIGDLRCDMPGHFVFVQVRNIAQSEDIFHAFHAELRRHANPASTIQ